MKKIFKTYKEWEDYNQSYFWLTIFTDERNAHFIMCFCPFNKVYAYYFKINSTTYSECDHTYKRKIRWSSLIKCIFCKKILNEPK